MVVSLARRVGLTVLLAIVPLVTSWASVGAQRAGDGGPIVELAPREAGLKGMVGHWWWFDAHLTRYLDAFADLGVTNVRLTTDWLQIEPEEGRRDFARTDRLFGALLARGIEPVPVFATIPVWASRNPAACRARDIDCEPDPAKLEAFERTIAELVGRYPGITRWEFWNEPEQWPGLADPSVYQRWYRAFYRAAKRANPQVRVAVGTMTGWGFLARTDPDLPFDAVTMHSYAGHIGDPIQTAELEQLRAGLLARGRDVPIWLTEYGWDSHWLNDEVRAETIRWVFDWLRAHPYIELAHYHMLHDAEDSWECCYGLLGPPPAFEPKRLPYEAYRAYVVRR